jgi:hypothetical protein
VLENLDLAFDIGGGKEDGLKKVRGRDMLRAAKGEELPSWG